MWARLPWPVTVVGPFTAKLALPIAALAVLYAVFSATCGGPAAGVTNLSLRIAPSGDPAVTVDRKNVRMDDLASSLAHQTIQITNPNAAALDVRLVADGPGGIQFDVSDDLLTLQPGATQEVVLSAAKVDVSRYGTLQGTLSLVSTPAGTTEDMQAKAMLLTVEDLRLSQWSEYRDPRQGGSSICGLDSSGVVGSASLTLFGVQESVDERVSVFRSEAEAAAWMATFGDWMNCRVDAVNRGQMNEKGWTFSQGSFSVRPFPIAGHETAAFWESFRFTPPGAGPPGDDGDTLLEWAFVRDGRVVVQLRRSGSYGPNPFILRTVAERAVTRVTGQ